MNRITIRGILVGPDYDDPMLIPEIEKGMFCPSSKILREIDEANGEPLDILIDSEGGDVFSFNAVANKLREYPAEVRLTVGACAFSEAANLILTSGRDIYVNPNSVVLWHSAMSTVIDGASGELRAEAELVDKINQPIKDALKAHGIPQADIERGFRDGGALVLGAEEMVRYGIAKGIVPVSGATLSASATMALRLADITDGRISAMAKRLRATINTSRMDKSTIIANAAADCDEEKKPLAEETEEERKVEEVTVEESTDETKVENPDTTTEEPAEEAPVEESTDDNSADEEKPADEGKPAEEDTDLIDKLIDKMDDFANRLTDLAERIDRLEQSATEEVAKAKAEAESAKQSLKAERTKRIGAMAAVVAAKSIDNGPADWPAAVKLCNGDKLKAYQRFPELAKAWAK